MTTTRSRTKRTKEWVQLTLFDLPGEEPDPAFWSAAKKNGKSSGPTFLRYRPRTRQLCADCIRDIHERGAAIAPLPAPVRWRLLINSAALLICERHKNERQENP